MRYEKLKGKLDDAIKRAGLESLVPEELEKHLIFNSNRLETFEDLYSEVVKCMEEKISSRIRDLMPSEVNFRESSDSTDFDVVSSLLSGKGKWSSDSRGECFKGDTAHFQPNRNAIKNMVKQTSGKGNQSKSWSMSEPSISSKGKRKENQRESKNPKELRVRTKVPKAHAKGNRWNWDRLITTHEEDDGWSFDGWNDEGNGVEWREDCEQTYDTSASSFSLERSEWEKMNLDTREALNSLNFGPEGIGGESFHDWIPDGEAWQFQGYDGNGFPRSLDGRLMDAYEVWNSSASASASAPASRVAGIACKEQQDFYVKHNGGEMIPTHSKIGQEMRVHFEKLLYEYGNNELIPVCLENDSPNFYLNWEAKSEETDSGISHEQNSEKTSQQSGNESGRAHRL